MNLIEMGGRPGTPSKERLRIADTLISQDSQAHQRDPEHHVPVWDQPGELNPAYQDAKMLLDYLDIYQFSMAAHETMEELHKAEQINSNVDLLPIVAQGSDEKFIGMIIDRGEPDTGQADPKETASEQTDEDGYGIVITCLYRHPEWIGLNEQFPWCRGLEVHIFSYRDTPEEPCIIIAVRPGTWKKSRETRTPTAPRRNKHRPARRRHLARRRQLQMVHRAEGQTPGQGRRNTERVTDPDRVR